MGYDDCMYRSVQDAPGSYQQGGWLVLHQAIAFVIAGVLLAGCVRASTARDSRKDIEEEVHVPEEMPFLIRLEESSCWAGGLHHRLTVFETGQIELAYSQSESKLEPDRLNQQQLSALRAAIQEADFFASTRIGMSFGTTQEGVSFQTDIRITYRNRGRSSYVQFTADLSTAPPKLVRLREQILQILDVATRFPALLKPEICCG